LALGPCLLFAGGAIWFAALYTGFSEGDAGSVVLWLVAAVAVGMVVACLAVIVRAMEALR
jgi:hypothetical protein